MKQRARFAVAYLGLLAASGLMLQPVPPGLAQTVFTVPLNNVSSTLVVGHLAGSGTLEVAVGEGALFGTAFPIRVTVARRNTLVNDQVVQSSTYTIFKVGGRTGDILTGVTAVEGTADRNYAKGDVVRVAITAGYLADIHAAVNTLETTVTGLPLDANVVHKGPVDETIAGNKTFSLPIVGSVTGNAATVTNGAYTTTANVFAQPQQGRFRDAGGAVYHIDAYGAVPGDGLDDSAALTAAIAASDAGGGGVVLLGPGVYRIDSQVTRTAIGGGRPPLVVRGTAGQWRADNGMPTGGSVLDLRSTTAPACIDLRDLSLVRFEGVAFAQFGTAHANPYIQTTNTILQVFDCAIYGHSSKSGTACDQDGIVLGGTSTVVGGAIDAPFQGYGSIIARLNGHHIRRIVYARVYANATQLRDINTFTSCGSNLAGGAAIELDGRYGGAGATGLVQGGLISGCWIEATNYVYPIKFINVYEVRLDGNSFYDESGVTAAWVRLEGDCRYISAAHGAAPGTKPGMDDASLVPASNVSLGGRDGLKWGTVQVTTNGADGLRVQKTANGANATVELGNSGTALDAIGTSLYTTSGLLVVRDMTATQRFQMALGGFAPLAIFTAKDAAQPVLVAKGGAGQGGTLFEAQNSGGTPLMAVKPDGSLQPAHIAEAAATNDSLFYCTTHSKLEFKDPAGVVNPLY